MLQSVLRQWCQTLQRKSPRGSELTWCNTLIRTVQIRNYSSLDVVPFVLTPLCCCWPGEAVLGSPCRHLPFSSLPQSKGYHTETGHRLVEVKSSCKCHGRSQWYLCEVLLACYYEGVELLSLPVFWGLYTFTVHLMKHLQHNCSEWPLHSLGVQHTCNFPPSILILLPGVDGRWLRPCLVPSQLW